MGQIYMYVYIQCCMRHAAALITVKTPSAHAVDTRFVPYNDKCNKKIVARRKSDFFSRHFTFS